jgi:hypothetical protein
MRLELGILLNMLLNSVKGKELRDPLNEYRIFKQEYSGVLAG